MWLSTESFNIFRRSWCRLTECFLVFAKTVNKLRLDNTLGIYTQRQPSTRKFNSQITGIARWFTVFWAWSFDKIEPNVTNFPCLIKLLSSFTRALKRLPPLESHRPVSGQHVTLAVHSHDAFHLLSQLGELGLRMEREGEGRRV